MLQSSSRDIEISKIKTGTRFREDYGNIEELAFDINKNGLISPIAVMPDGDNYTLLAGGRRLNAINKIREKKPEAFNLIPANVYNRKLTTLELRTIEGAENFNRKGMNYVERVTLLNEIHKLQMAEHGEKIDRSDDNSGWNQRRTAELLKISPATVTQDLTLAKSIEKFPDLELDNCKDKKAAIRKLNNFKKTLVNSVKADKFIESIGNLSRAKQQLINSYIVSDFFEGVKEVPSGLIDLVEIDSPYALDLDKNKKSISGGMCDHYNYKEITPEKYPAFTQRVLKECYRVMAPNSWLLKWFAPEPWFELEYKWLVEAGFEVRRMPCIWSKGSGQTKQFNNRLANSYEMFFYARKGDARLATRGKNNLYNAKPIYHEHKIHPTEKPIDLLTEILSTFVQPNSTILVPFLGSGNTILAAFQLKVKAIGFEVLDSFKDSYLIKVNELFD